MNDAVPEQRRQVARRGGTDLSRELKRHTADRAVGTQICRLLEGKRNRPETALRRGKDILSQPLTLFGAIRG